MNVGEPGTEAKPLITVRLGIKPGRIHRQPHPIWPLLRQLFQGSMVRLESLLGGWRHPTCI